MKVWFPVAETGTGAEVLTVQLADALSKRGIESVITRYPKQIEAMPWFLSRLKPPSKTDLLHLNAGSAAGFFLHRLPTVITGHGAFELSRFDSYKSGTQKIYHSKFVRPGISNAIASATAVTAVSRWVADIYRQEYSVPSVEVINNWVDTEFFSPVGRKRTRKLLFVGRKAWQKGSHLLPEIAKLFGSEFELTCTLGENEWTGSLPANVKLIGSVSRDKMPALYHAHDALIVPSIAEGFCLAAVEAMACGLPVFGFHGHGLDDALGPIAVHCSAEMSDVSALVATIKFVFEQPSLYREISETARLHVENSFTEIAALDKYIALYHKAVIA